MIKKFVKITGLHNVFNVSDSVLDITSIKEELQSEINQNSILFLTASEDTSYGYPDGTKYIWIMGTLYPIMPNRIFESKSELDTFVTSSEAVPGLVLSVTKDTISSNNGAYLVERNGASSLKLSKIVTGELDISGYMIEIYKKDNKYYYIDPISSEEIEVNDSSVDEEGKYLLLSLGEDRVFINSKDLISLENYYTKDEINASINNINSSINDLSTYIHTTVNSSISDISSNIATSLKSALILSNVVTDNSTSILVSSEKNNGTISNTSVKISGNNYIKLEGSSNNITLSADTATLADASNGIDGIATADDVYTELTKVEEVMATSVTTMANTLGLNSSLNVEWSEESGLTEDTIKAAIEDIAENKQDMLTAGSNINITNNTISAKGYEFNGETGGGFTEKYKQDSGDGGQIINNIATGLGSHAEGYNTQATGDYGSHAEGCRTIASYDCAHAEGFNTQASGDSSHAEGQGTKATSNYAHAEGKKTNATNFGCHAEGFETTAQNIYEHAEGTSNYSHTVSGSSYGNAGNTQHSVGIGGGLDTEEDTRKNAFEIMQNGDMYVLGVGGYQGTDTKVQNAAIKTLQEYIASLEARIAALEGNTTVS